MHNFPEPDFLHIPLATPHSTIKSAFSNNPNSHLKNKTTLFNPDLLIPSDKEPILPLKAASVLVTLVQDQSSLQVILTRRHPNLRSHPGQISFPGGLSANEDMHAEATALREAEEEINLPRNEVELIGRLPDLIIRSGYRITPVIGIIESSDIINQLNPNPTEVSEILTPPFNHLLNPDNYELITVDYQSQGRAFYQIKYKNHTIWGATACILMGLYEAISAT